MNVLRIVATRPVQSEVMWMRVTVPYLLVPVRSTPSGTVRGTRYSILITSMKKAVLLADLTGVSTPLPDTPWSGGRAGSA